MPTQLVDDATIMDVIEQLLAYQAPEVIYHPDGEAHVQVQEVVDENADPFSPSIAELFVQLEQQNLWGEWHQAASEQEASWLSDLMKHIVVRMKDKPCQLPAWLSCFSVLTERDAILTAIGDLSQLPLQQASNEQLNQVMVKIEELTLPNYDEDDVSQYLEQCMIDDALERLRACL